MTASLVFDVIMILILMPTIWAAVALNGRLTALRKDRDDLTRLVTVFNEAVSRAENSVARLRHSSKEADDTLRRSIEHAVRLRDDLAVLIEHAETLSRGLDQPSPPAADQPSTTRTAFATMDIESAAAAAERVDAIVKRKRAGASARSGPADDLYAQQRANDFGRETAARALGTGGAA